MDIPHSLFNELLQKFHAGTLSDAEALLFREGLLSGRYDEVVKEAVHQRLAQHRETGALTEEKKQLLLQQLMQQLQQETPQKTGAPVRRLRQWMVAAAVILLFILGGYRLFLKPDGQHHVAHKLPDEQDIAAPEQSTAYLTLADGKRVPLDRLATDVLNIGNGMEVYTNATGQIGYKGTPAVATPNTLTVPRGSRPVSLVLADGTKVWLDAGSALTYPTAFTGRERNVSLTGQAYFEVAHIAAASEDGTALPFTVTSGDVATKVLGTHFNVTAFKEEAGAKVTLLEGRVKVAPVNGGGEMDVRPGQQALWAEGRLKLNRSPDLDEVMAWHNDRFYFNGTDIQSVMQQVGRWYNVEVEFEEPFHHSCVADLPRNMPVSELLKIIELTGMVHFKIVQAPHKKIIVSR
ncbi:FecR domain-containing protein [Niabella sp. CC-SYL272]|uniref:FecR family protein n=1 Tax=Niabella agricola TaxID=2891571 RepID=UPI001F1EA11F|nr:FecR family protein [Niabella agricola]MCF3110237.1 FecR domain-containing protein [Niabella agricola]